MNHGKNLHLAIVEDSSDRAESHAATLRNAGYVTDFVQASDIDSLRRLLDTSHPDIILCGPGPGLPDTATVASLLPAQAPGIPLIAITDAPPRDGLVTLHTCRQTLVPMPCTLYLYLS